MKKYIYGLLILGSFAGCSKSEFESKLGNPDERLSEQAKVYQTQLAGAQYGWKAFLATKGQEVYTFTLKFDEKNRVTMISDVTGQAATPATSSYRLKSMQQPTLLFDTYSYIHIPVDPDPGTNGGTAGEGRSSDFEFIFKSASADTIKMEGTFNNSELLLVRLKTQEEADQVLPAVNSLVENLNKIKTYFKRLSYNGAEYEASIDAAAKSFTVTSITAGVKTSETSLFYIDGPKMIFFKPLKIGNTAITNVQDLVYEPTTGAINGSSGGKPLIFKEAIAPLEYDKTAADRFAANVDRQWRSSGGFTKDGVPDYLGLRSIPGYRNIIYWMNTSALGAPNRDLFGIVRTQIDYYSTYALPKPEINNGIMKYVQITGVAGAGSAPYNAEPIKTKVTTFINNFKIPQGFYVIQARDGVFDLVSAADARLWIQFQ
ncbi:DUF4302 domain-containing protein [Pedobacter caeni]|uniref:DUF4302 domain-containing protein n=1 Tax=Pedobacter caeni TaxID=288992 RepID=A0A1M5DI38_9SPHI|nr:DUF4302 domain-containing protein [Pedobacter caeni]SHF66663.1 protein of unknown function [Pedobacter caeni]